eukprot:CAMPEP_0198217712 /NCGR_PEP_ID=MMETSP1445-20131203/65439_1 /TAXON_ID=36898 /ORGANISM="Pyramimonas sp., Strain CCMP2087" /LENGTH=413 /DNA_ID=CAMNT_0043894501 /DNA_START=380 /DNA_END=1623 /DNA_ORIENTATION=+
MALKYISPGKFPGQEYHSDAIELQWTIDSFPCRKLGIGGKIEGELFQCGGATWRLCLYPDGCDRAHAGLMGAFLRLVSKNEEPRASYQMWLVPTSQSSAGPAQSSPACVPFKGVEYKDSILIEYKGDSCMWFDELLPSTPPWAVAAQRGGPRTFNACRSPASKDTSSQASWGFPTFYCRDKVSTDGYVTRQGSITIRCTVAVHSCVLRMSTSSLNHGARTLSVPACLAQTAAKHVATQPSDTNHDVIQQPLRLSSIVQQLCSLGAIPGCSRRASARQVYQLPSNAVAGGLFATAAEQKKVKRDFKRDFKREQQVQQMSSRLSRPTSVQRQICSRSGENHERQEAQQFHYPPSSASKSMASITASLGQYMKESIESKLQKSGFKPISREASLALRIENMGIAAALSVDASAVAD